MGCLRGNRPGRTFPSPAPARELYRRALLVFEEALGAEHPHTQVCREGSIFFETPSSPGVRGEGGVERGGTGRRAYRVSAKYSWLSALLTAFFGLLVARRWQALVP
jgi:hypothetical protein